jgi:CSLREA domain-containing protein
MEERGVPQSMTQRLGSICALAIALVGVRASAPAATFTVNTTDDAVDADLTDGMCDAGGGRCTLRAAIQQANVTVDADTVVLPAGTYRLTIRGSGEDASATGDLDITSDITIAGAGATSTIIDGHRAKDRVFEIRGNASISGVTVRRGRVSRASTGGGGLRTHGTLVLSDAVVTRCKAADDAGGIDVRGGLIMLRDVVVSRNKAGDDGGGMDVDGGTADLTRVLIQRNRARSEGGGLENSGAIVTLTDCQVIGNRARSDGGGLFNEDGGTMSLTGCLVSGNTAKMVGGISTGDTALGQNTTTVRDTTIANNRKHDCDGTVTSLGGNTDSDASCGF